MASRGAASGGKNLRILVAEDSPLCRELAAGLLRHMGHLVVTVGDGLAAADAATSAAPPFDVALMDIELPGLDGCEATEVIRARENADGLRRLAIFAMTGHDDEGCTRRCREAGMDGHLCKPVTAEALLALLARVAGGAGRAMDWSAARRAVRGNEDLLRRLVHLFLDEAPRLLAGMREAAEAGDATTLARHAHTLGGGMRHFDAPRAIDRAREIERTAGAGDLDGASALVEDLSREVDHLLPALRGFLGETRGPKG